ncbi:MAG: TRAP transporter substrate-binding protein DctP [Thermoleophilia bacterium]
MKARVGSKGIGTLISVLILAFLVLGCGSSTTTTSTEAGGESTTTSVATSDSVPPGETIELNFVSFVPVANQVEFIYFKENFIDKVNERANGELVINVRGGPEVVPVTNIGAAIQGGSIDMATIPTAFLEELVPGANQTSLSDYTAAEERENGIYEYTQAMYTEKGFHYLGRGEATEPGYFFLFLKKEPANIEDFKGLKLGGSPAFHGWFEALGAVVANLAMPEYFSGMERGVVDGLATSLYVGLGNGLQEVSGAVISPGSYRSTVVVPVNLEKWNGIPEHLQKILSDTMAEFEVEYSAYEAEQRKEALKAIEAGGAKVVTLAPEVEEWVQEAAREGAWKQAEVRFPGDMIPNLREKITKQ